ncbi:MAG: hypothetical protein GF307_13315 [candidate division Zixibacteria bacterium]|nr:hypothetical protein [candidate division Zixibacteria bacterium]
MKRIIREIKNFIIYLIIRGLLGFINALPLRWAYSLAGLLGRMAYILFPKDRMTALDNLRFAFPEISETKIKKIYEKSLENIGISAVDVLRFRRFGRQGILDMVEVEGLEHFDRAYEKGRGIVAITGHISNFELIAAWFGQSGYKSSAIGRRLYDTRFNRMLVDNREKMRVVNIDSEEHIKVFLKILREGYAVGVLIDQDSTRYRGIFVEFFGKAAYTPVGPVLIARKAKAAVVPIIIVRGEPGKYKMKVYPEIEFDHSISQDDDIHRVLQKCTGILEKSIAENPEQWVWMHRRWKTRPEDLE